MKKICVFLALVLLMTNVAGCSNDNFETTQNATTVSVSQTESVTEAESEETIAETTAETTVAETTAVETTTETQREINIEITSPNLNEGVWDVQITNTLNGENLSPELSWNPVDGASYYAVYMIDTKAYWLHMEMLTTDTSVALGQIDGSDGNKYVGPYPPYGTHPYNIYVVALKDVPGEVKTHFDANGNKIDDFLEDLDITQNGESGNIVGYGILEGEYSAEN